MKKQFLGIFFSFLVITSVSIFGLSRRHRKNYHVYDRYSKKIQSQQLSKKTSQMKVYAYLTELFEPSPELSMTDYQVYKILQQYPINKNVNYLVLPWRELIKRKELNRVPSIKLNGGFTVCHHPFFELIIPIVKKIGIDTIFASHAEKNRVYQGITVVPFPLFPINGVSPAEKKDILYSFIGSDSYKPLRSEILNMTVDADCFIKEREVWHFFIDPDMREKQKEEYQDVLARSRFSLCPRGTGPNSIRFWESLQAGAIPVLLADDFWLPEGVNWQECIIQIPEKDVSKINTIIRNVLPEQEEHMRTQCLVAYTYFAGNDFVRTIKEHYEK